MFYAAFPPEFNSGRMYAGPGSGSMRAAAAAWEGLASELQSTVSSYSSVIDSLTSGSWVGPSSVSMAAAVTPYLAWMQGAAGQAAEAATQATAAATAYETAFAAHVPPTEIAANRSQLAQLVATNVFGQNTPAIAATEIQYAEMWAQDALAMDSYASSSAAAANVTPFTEAPQITNAGGVASQAAAVTQAAGTLGRQCAVDRVVAVVILTTAGGPLSWLLQTGANLSTAYNTTVNGLLNSLFGPSGASTFTALYTAVKVPLGFTTQFNDIGLLTNFPVSQFLKFAPAAGVRRAPERRAGSRAGGAELGPGLADQLGIGGHGKCRHPGRQVVGPAELGDDHSGRADGGLRVVGRRARRGAGRRARRGRAAQFDVGGGDARQRLRRRGSQRLEPYRGPRPRHTDQGPQRRQLAGAFEASGGTNIGEARKRSAPQCRSRGS